MENWSSSPLNTVLVILATVLFLINLKNLYGFFPDLVQCVTRWKWNRSLEKSVSAVRSRNLCAGAMSLPLLLTVSCYGLVRHPLLDSLSPGTFTLCVAALFLVWMFMRVCIAFFLNIRTYRVFWNFFIAMTLLMLATIPVLMAFRVDADVCRICFLVELVPVFLTMLVRETQILGSQYPAFQTFLYLCALEFLPLGILYAAAMWLR